MRTVKIFFSYSRKDFDKLLPIFVQFQSVLKTVTFNGERHKVSYWFDQNTTPGTHWDSSIKWELKSADVVLFFVTPNFLESMYIQTLEIPLALERQENSKIHLIPILIAGCSYQSSSIGHLQFIPNQKGYLKPLNDWARQNDFWEYARFALKLSIVNSLSGLPSPFYFNNEQLSAAEKKKHILYFSPPEVNKLMKTKAKKKRKPKPAQTIFEKAKTAIKKYLKL